LTLSTVLGSSCKNQMKVNVEVTLRRRITLQSEGTSWTQNGAKDLTSG